VESVDSFLVHHEATFDSDELRRHISALVLTPTRLLVGHVDEHPAQGDAPSMATASTEAIPLREVRSVVVSRSVADPARYRAGEAPVEVVLTIGWGAIARVDLMPAGCEDPECDADHGYTGTVGHDDFSIRVSATADGTDTVQHALAFAADLSAATSRTP
jgi:Family of unknown function (DUF5998)